MTMRTTSCQVALPSGWDKRVVALINRRAYAEMIEGGPIDIGISPAQVRLVPC